MSEKISLDSSEVFYYFCHERREMSPSVMKDNGFD